MVETVWLFCICLLGHLSKSFFRAVVLKLFDLGNLLLFLYLNLRLRDLKNKYLFNKDKLCDILEKTGIKTIPKKKKCKKGNWLFEESLQIAMKRREAKRKGERERYKHLNAEFQRIARRDKIFPYHCGYLPFIPSIYFHFYHTSPILCQIVSSCRLAHILLFSNTEQSTSNNQAKNAPCLFFTYLS